MVRKLLITLLTAGAFALGLFLPTPQLQKETSEPPLVTAYTAEEKPFVLILSSFNGGNRIEPTLRSIYAQDYDNYRVIYIDDGSTDPSLAKATALIDRLGGASRTTLVHNPAHCGPLSSFWTALCASGGDEIALLLTEDDRMGSDTALKELNEAFWTGDTWMVSGKALSYPFYQELSERPPAAFYVALFRTLTLKDLFHEGKFFRAAAKEAIFTPLETAAKGHTETIDRVLTLKHTSALPNNPETYARSLKSLARKRPMQELSTSPIPMSAPDLVIFSEDRPMQLLATLESLQEHATGLHQTTVLYSASGTAIASAYLDCKLTFPRVRFQKLSLNEKETILSALFDKSPGASPHILLATDREILISPTNFREGTYDLERTGAYALFYSLHPRIGYSSSTSRYSAPPLLSQIFQPDQSAPLFAWQFDTSDDDWSFHNSFHFALYRKKDLKKLFRRLSFQSPADLFIEWGVTPPEGEIGLCYETATSITLFPETRRGESLAKKFEAGLKIDWESLPKGPFASKEVTLPVRYTPRD